MYRVLKMKTLLTLFALIFLPGLKMLVAQQMIKPSASVTTERFLNTRKQNVAPSGPRIALEPKNQVAQKNWDLTLTHHGQGIDHGSEISQTKMDSIKRAGSILKRQQELQSREVPQQMNLSESNMTVTPTLNTSFRGNAYNGWAPPDNNIAISDDGFIVSVINVSILFTDVTGTVFNEGNLNDFFSILELQGQYFDPKVIYDPVEDKFILVVLNGNTPETSTVVVAYSSSSDPRQTWWIYTYPGDPTGSNLWFDYASIGISTDDLYITGNLYTADRHFSQVLIYQFSKSTGYLGGDVNGIHWHGIQDAFGAFDFNVVPMSFGFDGSVGPGIFFISTDSDGGQDAMLYYTDNNAAGNPNLYVFRAPIPSYYIPWDGLMHGTTDELKINDCRVLSGFYADGTVHFAFNTRGDDFHSKVYYCRLNTQDLSVERVLLGEQPFEYAYPAVAPFTTSTTDRTVAITFLRTNSTIYPELRVAVCDNDLNWTTLLVKEGESYSNYNLNSPSERWGDYSGISRRHSSQGAEVWVAGCYGDDSAGGEMHVLNNWIGQITDGQTSAAPVAKFNADATSILEGELIVFTDQSTNVPTTWSWSFPGGTPATSQQKNPAITYHTAGVYDVTLAVSNALGNDIEVKVGYITVSGDMTVPVAEFTSDVTSVSSGGVVHYEDLSANNPTEWDWFFIGGVPSVSHEKNPMVVYPEAGCYDVTLIASNAAGSNVITRECYIDVSTSVKELNPLFKEFILYPNPAPRGQLFVEFEIEQPLEVRFSIVDAQGRLVRHLVTSNIKAGMNQLSFSNEPLGSGTYFLVVQDGLKAFLHTEMFVIAD